MSLAFAISLNIEGQLNVAAGVARAIEVSVSDLDGVRAISGSQERAERAGGGGVATRIKTGPPSATELASAPSLP
jgi:hypothetical protein